MLSIVAGTRCFKSQKIYCTVVSFILLPFLYHSRKAGGKGSPAALHCGIAYLVAILVPLDVCGRKGFSSSIAREIDLGSAFHEPTSGDLRAS